MSELNIKLKPDAELENILLMAKALASSVNMVNHLKEMLDIAYEALEYAPDGHTVSCLRMSGGNCSCWQGRRRQFLDLFEKLEA